MQVKEAKDFLVEQTAQQAAIQSVPLSELERKMMYFTESDDSCESPLQLNGEFEAQYDTPGYEAKIARLMKNTYARIKKENPEAKRRWDEAIKELSKGDHYILVLWRTTPPSEHPRRDAILQVGIGVAIAFLFFAVIVIREFLSKK